MAAGKKLRENLNGPILLLLVVFPLMLISSCSFNGEVIERPVINIINQSSRIISRIEWKFCDADDSHFSNLIQSVIHPGTSRSIYLDTGCRDFRAINSRGVIIGRQFNTHIPPSMKWVIY